MWQMGCYVFSRCPLPWGSASVAHHDRKIPFYFILDFFFQPVLEWWMQSGRLIKIKYLRICLTSEKYFLQWRKSRLHLRNYDNSVCQVFKHIFAELLFKRTDTEGICSDFMLNGLRLIAEKKTMICFMSYILTYCPAAKGSAPGP